MKAAVRRVLDLFYPPKCVICQKLLSEDENGACKRCLLDLPLNTVPVPRGDFFDACCAPFWYRGTLRDSLLRYKFGGMQHYAVFYSEYLAASVQAHLSDRFDLISWVPIHPLRRLSRGYDQARLLAEETAKRLGAPCLRCLRKIRHNRRQSRIRDDSVRKANVKGAYQAVQPTRFQGKRVLLIDDILTSGATLSECAFVLRSAGAASVTAACAATARREDKES